MVTTTGAFVQSVIQTFDEQNYLERSSVNLIANEQSQNIYGLVLRNGERRRQGLPECPTPTDEELLQIPQEIGETLPGELRGLIASHNVSSLGEWAHMLGIFDSSICERDTDKVIEDACRQKLEELRLKNLRELKGVNRFLQRPLLRLHANMAIVQHRILAHPNAQAFLNRRDHLRTQIDSLKPLRRSLQAQKARLEEAINSTKRSLSNPFVTSTKRALLVYTFDDAFAQGTDTEKERIISAAYAFQPKLQKAQSTAKRIAIKVMTFVATFLNDPAVQLIAFVYIGIKIWAIYHAAYAALQFLVKQTFGPILMTALIHRCPIVVLQAVNVVFGGVTWLIQHQWHLFVSWSVTSLFLDSIGAGARLTRMLDILFISTLPLISTWILFGSTIQLAGRAVGLEVRDTRTVGNSILRVANRSAVGRYEIEREKARALWLQLIDQVQTRREANLHPARPLPPRPPANLLAAQG